MAKVARKRPQLLFQDNAFLDPAKQAGMLDQARKAGGTGIQQDVVWGNIRKNGAYDPAAIAALMAEARAANARGLRPQFRLMGTPYYQQQNQPGVDTALSSINANPGLMRQFATDMAKTFGGQVGKYSIWNEPNIHSFLMKDNPAVAAQAYRHLYQAGYQGIKAGNANAKVGFGELTSGDPKATGAASTVGFLNRVLAGKKPLRADYAAIHPYQWTNPGAHPAGMDPGFGGISNLGAVQKALAQAFAQHKLQTSTGKRVPLSLSEFGYKHDIQKNPAVRAQWLKQALTLANRAGVDQVNMYQMTPSKAGDYWDSSIANSRGVIDPRVRQVLRRSSGR